MRNLGSLAVVLGMVVAAPTVGVPAQLPTLPTSPKPAQAPAAAPAEKVIAAPTKDNPDATIAETAGPIAVTDAVSDWDVRRKLEKLLPRLQGVRDVQVEVEDGVVTLTGHVEDNEVRDRLRDFVRRVQGVNLIINQTKTDAQVLTARQFAMKQVREYRDVIASKWLLALLSLAMVVGAALLARLFHRFSETLLMPLSGNMLLRSVLGSVIATVIVLCGVLLALKVLGLTEAVLSFLGLAGVVALAVGFAFRDITENFISSILLGLRRPFRVGDYIEIAGYAGVVKSLSTRATVLATLEGNQVRILNSTIYKEVLINKSASSSVRGTFDVILPYEVSIASATEAIARALAENEAIERDPAPRALVEALEPGGVRIRSYFWSPTKGVDGFKLNSDAKLAAKVALQKVGITPGGSPTAVVVSGAMPAPSRRSLGASPSPPGSSSVTPAQARDNLRQDSDASDAASSRPAGGHVNLMEHALTVAGNGTMDEGENLLDADEKKKDDGGP